MRKLILLALIVLLLGGVTWYAITPGSVVLTPADSPVPADSRMPIPSTTCPSRTCARW